MKKIPCSLLLGVVSVSIAIAQSSAGLPALDEAGERWVETTLAALTDKEKVGQLIVAGVGTNYTPVGADQYREIMENIERYRVGGYHAFGGEVLSAAFLIRRMQQAARVPLLITADLEGGAGLIFRGGTRFPKAMAIGATFDSENAFKAGQVTAMEAKATGVNVNFYPVVDVNNNQRNPIINIRSFGEDPLRVSDMAKAYIRGGQGQGVLATAKHFPGHGDTATDSHLDLPVIEASKDRLNSVELPPFRAAVETGVAAVMTAHVSVPALEKEVGLPATLSRSVMTGLLREEMRFDGLIFTDAMNMGGIVRKYPPGEAALKAFTAGVDIILYPTSVKEACEGLLEGVRLGKISRERLDASVRRILETKARLGLHRRKQVDLLEIDSKVGLQEHQKTAQSIMDAAVTLVRDQGGVLPLGKLTPDDEVLVVTLLDERRPQETRGAAFVQALQQRHKKCTSVEILPGTPEGEVRLVRDLARRCDYVVAGAYVRVSAFKGSIEVSPNQIQLLKSLAALDKPAAFVLFGSPYLLLSAPELPNCIVTYEDYPGAELAAVKAVLGEIPFRGRLPISLPGLYSTGHGVMK